MFLCSRLTCDASIRSLARNGLLHPSISGSCKRHFIPFPSPPSNSSHSLARWDPECSREQAGDHLGRIHLFTLWLSFAISVRVAGSWAPPFPRGSMLLLVCLAVSQRQKEFSSQKGFLCYFVGLAFIFSNIARLLTPHEMT